MVVLLLVGKDVFSENFIRMEAWQKLQTFFVISVDIDIIELSIQAFISDSIMYAINILTFSIFVSFFSVIVGIISPQCVPEVGEAFYEFTNHAHLLKMQIYINS